MSFGYYRPLTIDHTKCGASNTSNFAYLFSATIADLKTVANGGKVTSNDGYDIVFTSDAEGLTVLDFEIEKYVPTTGQLIAWVKIPTLSYTVDTVIYLFYSNPSITTSQEDPSNVWSSYSGVWHLEEASDTRLDSTSNNNDLTDNNSVGAGAGKIDGAADLTPNDYLTVADTASLSMGDNDFTIECWLSLDSKSANMAAYGKGSAATELTIAYCLRYNQATDRLEFIVENNVSSSGRVSATDFGSPPTGTLIKVVCSHSAASNTVDIQVNNGPVTSAAWSGGSYNDALGFVIGRYPNLASAYWDGIIDELRIIKSVLSASQRTAHYNNESAPATFAAVGDEVVLTKPSFFFLFT